MSAQVLWWLYLHSASHLYRHIQPWWLFLEQPMRQCCFPVVSFYSPLHYISSSFSLFTPPPQILWVYLHSRTPPTKITVRAFVCTPLKNFENLCNGFSRNLILVNFSRNYNYQFSRQHNSILLNRTTCFDQSFSHLQVLNMLQVSESCAHVWDPNSVYNEAINETCNILRTWRWLNDWSKHVVRFSSIKLLC